MTASMDQVEEMARQAIYAFLEERRRYVPNAPAEVQWKEVAFRLADEHLAKQREAAIAQPNSRRYFITLTKDAELALLIYAQHNNMVKTTDGEITEHDRQHIIHESMKRLIAVTVHAIQATHRGEEKKP